MGLLGLVRGGGESGSLADGVGDGLSLGGKGDGEEVRGMSLKSE